MSSSALALAPPQRYYCHKCDRAVSIAAPASRDDDVFCPLCAGGFVEELLDDEDPPNPSPHPFFPFSSFLHLRNPSELGGVLGPPSPSATRAAAASSNPSNQFDVTSFLQGHLGGLLSGGATIQIVLEGSSFAGGFASFGSGGPAPGAGGVSLVDYFMGSGLEQLIQQLAENDPSRYGTLPAAKAAVAALPDVAVSA